MRNTLDDLERLDALLQKGVITEEEFKKEKEKILNSSSVISINKLFGLSENTYCFLIHISILLGFVYSLLGILAPLTLWLVNRAKYESIDKHGKAVINWLFSLVVHTIAVSLLVVLVTSFDVNVSKLISYPSTRSIDTAFLSSTLLAFPLLKLLTSILVVFGAVNASMGKLWRYPLTIRFFKD